jgi:hypothetical protein
LGRGLAFSAWCDRLMTLAHGTVLRENGGALQPRLNPWASLGSVRSFAEHAMRRRKNPRRLIRRDGRIYLEIHPHEILRRTKKGDACWEWTGPINGSGYGYLTFTVGAHRLSFALERGEIEPGKHLDHTCRNPKCVRPNHLQEVTPVENVLRGQSLIALNRLKTRCIRGHLLSGNNLRMKKRKGRADWRACRHCQREAMTRYNERLAVKEGREYKPLLLKRVSYAE